MKKKFLCFLITSLFICFISCTNNSDDNLDKKLILPRTITYKDHNNKIYQTATFTYDNDKIVRVSNGKFRIEFSYKGNQIVREIQYKDCGEIYLEKKYDYLNNNLRTVTTLSEGKETKCVYINNGDGTIDKQIYNFNETGKELKREVNEILFFENGNLIKRVSNWEYKSYITTCRYDYDTNISVFKNIKGLNLMLDEVGFGSEINISSSNNLQKHNVFTEVVLKPDEAIIFEPFLNTMNYEYNSKSYPIKKTTYDYTGEIIEIIEYTY